LYLIIKKNVLPLQMLYKKWKNKKQETKNKKQELT